MNFKRKHFKSSTMKKCAICGSQRRGQKRDEKEKNLEKVQMKEAQGVARFDN